MTHARREEHYYIFHLQKYFSKYYCEYAETVEFYVNPAINKWHFIIPELNLDILLTCYDDGRVVERREVRE